MKKKILICGATGFIGRNLAEHFAQNNDYEVYGTFCDSQPWQDPRVHMVKADLRKKEDVNVAVKGMDIIIQAAATTSGAKEILSKPYYHVTDNAVMNSLIFRSAFDHDIAPVVFFSCSIIYQSSNRPVKETDFDASQEIFPSYFGTAWTKIYLEKLCEFYARIGQTKYTVIRHSNIFGPYDKFDLEKSHVFGATMTKVMLAPEGGKIVVWGTGEERRDLLYVADLVDFVEAAVHKQDIKFELVNVGCGSFISINELVQKIIHCTKKKIVVEHDTSKPTIKTSVCLDISRAREKFNWSPKISFEEGIRKTMDWYRHNVHLEEAALKK